MTQLPYNRILIKLSGERMAGDTNGVLDMASINELAAELAAVKDTGAELAVVLGGGNILRGAEIAEGGHIDEAQGHHMGMLATVINALALQSVLEAQGKFTRVMTAADMPSFAEPYIRRRSVRHMEKGRIVIFAGGTGNPFFTTDTAGALRAVEVEADVLIKVTKVDGIYTADPAQDATAVHIPETTYKNVLVDDLKVMDGSAIALCKENKLPLMVCKTGTVLGALAGKEKHTIITA